MMESKERTCERRWALALRCKCWSTRWRRSPRLCALLEQNTSWTTLRLHGFPLAAFVNLPLNAAAAEVFCKELHSLLSRYLSAITSILHWHGGGGVPAPVTYSWFTTIRFTLCLCYMVYSVYIYKFHLILLDRCILKKKCLILILWLT